MKLRLLLVIFIITLNGCAATGPIFSRINDLPDGQGVVYLYRPKGFVNSLIKPGMSVDGQQYAVLPPNGYMPFVLPTGQHTFNLILSERYTGDGSSVVNVQASRDVFIRLETFNKDIGDYKMMRVFRLVPVATGIGSSEIKKCRYVDPNSENRHSKSIIISN